jgi:hypothetical protein
VPEFPVSSEGIRPARPLRPLPRSLAPPARARRPSLRMRSNGSVHPPHAVILRQRSPWQSQGLPTKDLCTSLTPQKRGVPHPSAFLALGWERRTPSCFQPSSVIPSAARSSARRRSCGVEGPAFLRTPDSNHPAASPARGEITGLSTPGTNSQASPFPPSR